MACLREFTPRHYTGGNPVRKGQRAVLTRPANADWFKAGQGNTPPIRPHLIIKPQELRFTKLLGITTHHTSMRHLICKYCGQMAGPSTTCPVYSDPKHVFVQMEMPAFCKYCGQMAGIGSKCPVGSDERHVFVSRDED